MALFDEYSSLIESDRYLGASEDGRTVQGSDGMKGLSGYRIPNDRYREDQRAPRIK